MRVNESCARCLYDKQMHLTQDVVYLEEIRNIIKNRSENDCSPYLVYLFNQVYKRRFGDRKPYSDIKKKYNDLVLSMEEPLKKKISRSEDSLAAAFAYARIGNYIDFGAMNTVEEETFLSLFDDVKFSDRDVSAYESFVKQCSKAKRFLLIADNCGEIVLDKIFIEMLQKRFPMLHITIMVRGKEVLNDATEEDAIYVGLDKVCRVIGNGNAVAGTVYDLLTEEAKFALDQADVILAKGQGNYESLCRQGRHIFYSFLCKCELFTSRFNVPKLTGIFIEEME